MGLFDQIGGGLKAVMGQALGQIEAEALPGVLSQVLSKTDLGSVGGLVAKLQQGGLADQVTSWLGNGSNMPVSADQIRAALENQQVQQIANQLGLPTDQILAFLSQHLPGAVDKMSPKGTIEEAAGAEDLDAEAPSVGEEQSRT